MAKKLSFYCTLSGQLESNGYDYSEEPESVSNDFLVDNAWKISQQLKKEQSDVDMAEYLPEELGGKIASVVWSVDELHGNLVGKIDCTVTGELTEAEIECLKEWIISSQVSMRSSTPPSSRPLPPKSPRCSLTPVLNPNPNN